jgi:hypothetical protein
MTAISQLDLSTTSAIPATPPTGELTVTAKVSNNSVLYGAPYTRLTTTDEFGKTRSLVITDTPSLVLETSGGNVTIPTATAAIPTSSFATGHVQFGNAGTPAASPYFWGSSDSTSAYLALGYDMAATGYGPASVPTTIIIGGQHNIISDPNLTYSPNLALGLNVLSNGTMLLQAKSNPGTSSSYVTLQASTGIVFKDNANVVLATVTSATGNLTFLKSSGTISYNESGGNKRTGVATLVGGTVTISVTGLASGNRFFLTNQNGGTAPGSLYVSSWNSSGFTISSTSATDDCKVAWLITNSN